MKKDFAYRVSRNSLKGIKSNKKTFKTLSFNVGMIAFICVVFAYIAVLFYYGDPRTYFMHHAKAAVSHIKREAKVREEVVYVSGKNENNYLKQLLLDESLNEITEASVDTLIKNATIDTDILATIAERDGPPYFLSAGYTPFAGISQLYGYFSASKRVLLKNQTIVGALRDAGLVHSDIVDVLKSLKEHLDFRYLRPGNHFKLFFDALGTIQKVEVFRGVLSQLQTVRTVNGWEAAKIEVKIESKLITIHGSVESTLWVAMTQSGESAALVTDFVDVFAWEIDFYSEVFAGDSFKVTVEKNYVDDRFIGYGSIIAAEFISNGEKHQAYAYMEGNDVKGYFDDTGHSMRKQLLKSPLKFGAITSKFGKRRHPVLGYRRSHNGIDYGVSVGTPVWSVGDGRVVKAGRHGGFGNLIEIKHPNGWLSQYAHLSAIGVRVGDKVEQKQYIGKSGNTGLSSGPHLHYGLKLRGKYVNPSIQKFSRGKSLNADSLQKLKQQIALHTKRFHNVGVLESS